MPPSHVSPDDSLHMLPYFSPDDRLALQQYASSGTTRHELLRMHNRDLHRLLSIRDDTHFRRQITHDNSVRNFLQSFLRLKRRPFDTEALVTSEDDDDEEQQQQLQDISSDSGSERRLESLLARRVLMVYMRMGGVSQHDDDDDDGIGRRGAPDVERDQQQQQQQDDQEQQKKEESDSSGILDMPTILDLCAVYGFSNGRLLRALLTTLVLQHPQQHLSDMRALATPVMQTIAHTHSQVMNIRQQQQQQQQQQQESQKQQQQHTATAIIMQLTEMGRFLYDLFFTLRTLLEVFPLSALVLQYDHRLPLERTLLGHVALVYESTLPAMLDTLQQLMTMSSSSVSDLELYIHQTWFNAVQVGGVIIRECFLVRLDAWIMRESASSSGDNGTYALVDRHIVRVLRQWQQDQEEREQRKKKQKQKLAQGQKRLVQSMCQYIHSGRSRQLFPMMQHEDEGEQEMESLELVFYNLVTSGILHVATTLAQESQGDLPAFDTNDTRGSFLLDYNHIHGLTDTLRQWLTHRYTSLRESCIGEFLTVLRSTKQQLHVEIDQQNDYLPEQPQQSPSHTADTLVASSSSSSPDMQYTEQIESIREMFPDLGRGFLHMCLAAFDGDIATVTHHLLEDSLPRHLQDLDRTLEHVPQDSEPVSRPRPESTASPTSPSSSSTPSFRITYNTRAPRAATISDDLAPVPWEHASMFSRVHLGQKKKKQGDSKLGKISADLARRIVESYNYDDEYDDTYDDVVNFDVEGDMSDPYSKLRREQQASGERGTAQQRQTSAATTATADRGTEGRSRSSSSDAPQKQKQQQQQQQQPANYQRKEQQKARVANHGRKKKAAKKRFVSMQ